MKSMKKVLGLGLAIAMMSSVFAGCGSKNDNDNITVLSREESSGTRGAFIELFGIEEKDSDGNKVDKTIKTSEVTQSTAVMMSTVEGNSKAIGYTSLGSLNDNVKAIKIEGVEATVDNIKNNTYPIYRPFNIATKGEVSELSDVAQDFINFILSDEGQKIIEDSGYVSKESTGAFTSSMASGEIKVGGSSSVSPVMEKLKEAYLKINTNATIELQENDSTTGTTSTIEGLYDIGMASRELKDSEKEAGLVSTVIGFDGIAVIVNKENSVDNLTIEQVKQIYTGEITTWSQLQ